MTAATLAHPRTSLRTIGWFALGGTIGPLLIVVLHYVQYDDRLYHPLHVFISALCPAWLLGPLEYSYGPAVTWTIIFATNVAVWALLGAIVAIGRRVQMRVVAFALVSALAVAYAYWITQSAPAVFSLVLVLVGLFFASGAWVRAGDA